MKRDWKRADVFSKSGTAILLIAFLTLDAEAARSRSGTSAVEQSRIEIANLKEDVAFLQQEVGRLVLGIERISRENLSLKRLFETRVSSQTMLLENYVTIAQLNNELERLRLELTSSGNRKKAEIVAKISRQMVRLATQTEKAISSLADSINAQPELRKAIKFSNEYPKSGMAYTVRPGDTLSRIASKYNSTVTDIQNANKIVDPTKLMAGTTIFIPQAKREPSDDDS